jgi:hypothetical protein
MQESLELQNITDTREYFTYYSHSAEVSEDLIVSNPTIEREIFSSIVSQAYVDNLIDMFCDKENRYTLNYRLLALRVCVPFFFYEPEGSWTADRHEIFKIHNRQQAERIYPYLLAAAHSDERAVKDESQYLLRLIAESGVTFNNDQ